MEWVTSKELMQALGATEPDPDWRSPNADAVLRRARDGVMHARARDFFRNEERQEGELPKEFWWAGDDSYYLRRNWVTGDFLTNDPRAGDEWRPWKAYGVQWRKEDAEAMGADFKRLSEVVAETKTGAGRKRDDGRWQSFYFNVITISQEGRLTKNYFNTSKALADEILQMMGKDAFDDDYVKPIVSQIFKKFVGN